MNYNFLNKTQIVIGVGDVGKALVNILSKEYKVECFDIKSNRSIGRRSLKNGVIHISFPYDRKFVENVKKYQKALKPVLTIIHSTVAVGTTEKIGKAVHSPIRGVHKEIGSIPGSSIEEGLYGWKKQIGGSDRLTLQASKIFEKVGIKTELYDDSKKTELGKLLCNIQWALSLAFTQEMERICDHFDLDFDETVKEMNELYNEGLENLGGEYKKRNRPVCYPGYIGGKCLMENIEILKNQRPSEFFDLIEKSNKQFKNNLERGEKR